MTTKLDSYTFPVDPTSFKTQFPVDLKEVSLKISSPLILLFGPKVTVMKLSGFLGLTGVDADTAFTNYVLPLKTMAKLPMGVPRVLGDDDMITGGDWSAYSWGSGSVGNPTVSDSTEQVKKGTNAVKAVVPSGAALYAGIRQTFSPAIDISKNRFISFWAYSPSAVTLAAYLKDASNEQTVEIAGATGWSRPRFLLSDFSSINLKNITEVRIGEKNSAATFYFDRVVIGVGFFLDAPGIRYDGLCMINKLSIEESSKAIAFFPYELELWDTDDYY